MNEIRLACYTGPWGLHGLVGAIQNISSCGFDGVEAPSSVVTEYEDRLHVFEEILETRSLRLAGLRQELNLLERENPDEIVERAANSARFVGAAGHNRLTICHNAVREEPMTEEDWATLGAIAEEIGDRCNEFDVDFCFLPRTGRLVSTEKDIKRFLASTREKNVKLAIDTGEVALAGGSPHRVINHHFDRIRAIRFRDVSASKRRALVTSDTAGSTPQFGRGAVKFEAVSKALLNNGYSGWITVDVSGEAHSPLEAISDAHRFLIRKSGLFS